MSECTRVHVRVAGRVQGVGFRYSAYHEARRLGVCGWVQNQPNGDVEGEAEGPAAAVERFLTWWRQGPPLAQVTTVHVQEFPASAGYKNFEIRF